MAESIEVKIKNGNNKLFIKGMKMIEVQYNKQTLSLNNIGKNWQELLYKKSGDFIRLTLEGYDIKNIKALNQLKFLVFYNLPASLEITLSKTMVLEGSFYITNYKFKTPDDGISVIKLILCSSGNIVIR